MLPAFLLLLPVTYALPLRLSEVLAEDPNTDDVEVNQENLAEQETLPESATEDPTIPDEQGTLTLDNYEQHQDDLDDADILVRGQNYFDYLKSVAPELIADIDEETLRKLTSEPQQRSPAAAEVSPLQASYRELDFEVQPQYEEEYMADEEAEEGTGEEDEAAGKSEQALVSGQLIMDEELLALEAEYNDDLDFLEHPELLSHLDDFEEVFDGESLNPASQSDPQPIAFDQVKGAGDQVAKMNIEDAFLLHPNIEQLASTIRTVTTEHHVSRIETVTRSISDCDECRSVDLFDDRFLLMALIVLLFLGIGGMTKSSKKRCKVEEQHEKGEQLV